LQSLLLQTESMLSRDLKLVASTDNDTTNVEHDSILYFDITFVILLGSADQCIRRNTYLRSNLSRDPHGCI